MDSALYGFDEFKLSPNIELKAQLFYGNNFITVDTKNVNLEAINSALQLYPAEFENVLEAPDLNKFDDKLCWFKVVFPPGFDETALDEMIVSINCFPILNRHLNEVRYRLQSLFNIVPLTTTENFFDVKNAA